LADETRLRLLSLLIQNSEMNVRSLCQSLDQSQPAVSHHLALLREAGLVCSRRDGKHNFYRCIPERLDSVIDISWRDVMVPSPEDEEVPAPSVS
jgi:ArsR family transcriptional regulator